MKNTRNIYLIGFMGAGKTSVGRSIAGMLQRSFIDLDCEIENREGLSIPEIFRLLGEEAFRAIERRELLRVSALENQVIALGGGAFCIADNQQLIAPSGIAVWLDVSLEEILSRCKRDGTRPLLAGQEKMRALMDLRRPFYAKADIHINAGTDPVDVLAEKIIHILDSSY